MTLTVCKVFKSYIYEMNKTTFLIAAFLVLVSLANTAAAQQQKKLSQKSTNTSTAHPKDMLTLLQGRWSSLEDKKTFFQIEEDRQIDIYGKDILDTATINFYDECPKRVTAEDEKRKSGHYLIVSLRPNDFYCYSVDKLTSQQLVLTYLPKGTILKYKKVPTVKLQSTNEETEY
jgi:hypothetical protein